VVNRLERQLILEALRRPGVEISSRLQRAIALETGAVALEAERPSLVHLAFGFRDAAQSGPLQGLPARRAQNFGASALQLAAWKGNPFICGRFCALLAHEPQRNPTL
jgi:hypothetical protein